MTSQEANQVEQNLLNLKQSSAEWKEDGSSGNKVEIQDSEVTISSKSSGTPFNIMFKTSPNDSAKPHVDLSYFEVVILENQQGKPAIGWVTKSEFQPGWKCKGMFYNGNTTNGSAAKTVAFGEYTKKGMTVGSLLENDGSSCNVYFFVNGQCLGCAFSLTQKKLVKSRRYPCLHISGEAKVQWNIPENVPRQRQRDQSNYPNEPYKGDWQLTKIVLDGSEFPLPCEVTASLDRDTPLDTVLRFSLCVGNTLRTGITLTGSIDERSQSVTMGPIASTLRGSPPHISEAENKIRSALPKVTKIIVQKSGNDSSKSLIMNGSGVELTFKPYQKTFQVLTDYE